VDVVRGDDPNVPQSDSSLDPDPSETIHLTVYPDESISPDDPFAVPFHMPCYELFAQVVAFHLQGKTSFSSSGTHIIRRETLWQVLKGLHPPYGHALSLDYGELARAAGDQYWWKVPGDEASYLLC
jgi:hypothetical protein